MIGAIFAAMSAFGALFFACVLAPQEEASRQRMIAKGIADTGNLARAYAWVFGAGAIAFAALGATGILGAI